MVLKKISKYLLYLTAIQPPNSINCSLNQPFTKNAPHFKRQNHIQTDAGVYTGISFFSFGDRLRPLLQVAARFGQLIMVAFAYLIGLETHEGPFWVFPIHYGYIMGNSDSHHHCTALVPAYVVLFVGVCAGMAQTAAYPICKLVIGYPAGYFRCLGRIVHRTVYPVESCPAFCRLFNRV